MQTHAFLAELDAQPSEIDSLPPEATVLNLACQRQLTVYDAASLGLVVI